MNSELPAANRVPSGPNVSALTDAPIGPTLVAATVAKSVHFTGQWKRLQPHVAYDRPARRIVIHDRPAPPPRAAEPAVRTPAALNVIMLEIGRAHV